MPGDSMWQEHAVYAFAWDSRGRWHRIAIWPEGGAVHARYDVRVGLKSEVVSTTERTAPTFAGLGEWLRQQAATNPTTLPPGVPPEAQAFVSHVESEERESVAAAMDRALRQAADAWPEYA